LRWQHDFGFADLVLWHNPAQPCLLTRYQAFIKSLSNKSRLLRHTPLATSASRCGTLEVSVD
jgi:hypothetical protein